MYKLLAFNEKEPFCRRWIGALLHRSSHGIPNFAKYSPRIAARLLLILFKGECYCVEYDARFTLANLTWSS